MFKRTIFAALFIAITSAVGFNQAYAFELNSEAYIVGEPENGKILLEKSSKTILQPASLTKMMTLYMLFEAIERGELGLDSEILISEKAWRAGGSKMFVEVGKMARVEDLIKGIAISSGNDACIVVAERLGGSEESFAEMMTTRAHALGMSDTNFLNASGWPMEGHLSTAHDMFTLALALINDFPQYYSYFSGRSFTYSKITQYNRNGLLRRNVGVDGLKTGHTDESGYHLVASAKRDGQRFVAVVMGTDSMKARESEALKGLSWAFSRYKTHEIIKEGETIKSGVPVAFGTVDKTPLVAGEKVKLLLTYQQKEELQQEVVVNLPLTAPLQKGQQVGSIVFSAPNMEQVSVPLVVGEAVEEKQFIGKMFEKIKMSILN